MIGFPYIYYIVSPQSDLLHIIVQFHNQEVDIDRIHGFYKDFISFTYTHFYVFILQSLSRVQFFVTPWIAARQASLSITISRSSLRLMSIESVMPSSHLILGHPLILQPPIPPSIRVFSNESTLRMRWPKYWSFSFSIIPSKEHPGLISFRQTRIQKFSADFLNWPW